MCVCVCVCVCEFNVGMHLDTYETIFFILYVMIDFDSKVNGLDFHL